MKPSILRDPENVSVVTDEPSNVAKPVGTVPDVQFVGVLKSPDAGFANQASCASAAGAAASIAAPTSAAPQQRGCKTV